MREIKKSLRLQIFLAGLVGCLLFLYLPGCKDKIKSECEKYDSRFRSLLVDVDEISNRDAVYKECKAALIKCPNLLSAYELMGNINLVDGYYEDAVKDFSIALKLNTSDKKLKKKADLASVYNAGEIFIIGTDGSIKTRFIGKLTLNEYSQIDEELRVSWCETIMNTVDKEEVEIGITPSELDDELISKSNSEPGTIAGEAAWRIVSIKIRIKGARIKVINPDAILSIAKKAIEAEGSYRKYTEEEKEEIMMRRPGLTREEVERMTKPRFLSDPTVILAKSVYRLSEVATGRKSLLD